jgi:hypothetical protein
MRAGFAVFDYIVTKVSGERISQDSDWMTTTGRGFSFITAYRTGSWNPISFLPKLYQE